MDGVFVELTQNYKANKGKCEKIVLSLKIISILMWIFTFVDFFLSMILGLNKNPSVAYMAFLNAISAIGLFSSMALTINVFKNNSKKIQLISSLAALPTILLSTMFIDKGGLFFLFAIVNITISIVLLVLVDKWKKIHIKLYSDARKDLLRNAKAVNTDLYELLLLVRTYNMYDPDNNVQLLSLQAILDSKLDNYMPIINYYNNEYLVYNFSNNEFERLNIVNKKIDKVYNLKKYLEMFDPRILTAKAELIKWLSDERELGKAPKKLEYTNKFEYEDSYCYIFKYKKVDSDNWFLGISSDMGSFSEMKEYNENSEIEDATRILKMLEDHWKSISKEMK